jgi:hypothetical protein
MPPEVNGPGAETPPTAHGETLSPFVGLKPQPGFVVSLCSIAAGLVGFSVPVLGMIASCAGIWLGIWGFHQGRAARYTPSVACGLVGLILSLLSIVFWVCAILFESYH